MLKLLSVLVLIFTFGIGQMWGAEYEIVFKTPSSDSQDLGASPAVSSVVKSGDGYVDSFSSCSKLFVSSSGAKLGSSSASGTINFTLKTNYQSNIKSIQIVSSKYGSDTGTLTLYGNGTSLKTGISPASGYTHTFSTAQTVTSIKVTTSTKRAYISKIVITTEETPAFTVTATSNNNSYGTVAVAGGTITATPADCYQVVSGTGGYTLNSGTASSITHSDNSNTISVVPTSNCNLTINFEKKAVNTYIDDIQDNGTFEDCSTIAPTLNNKTTAITGTCAQQHWHFVGWVPEAYKATPKGHITNGGSAIVVNGTTYYAVWSKGSAGSITLSQSDLTTGITNSYGSGSVTKGDYTFNTYGCKQSSKLQMRKSDSYVQIPTLPGAITGISSTACYNTSDGNYTGTLRLKSAFAAGNTTTNDVATKDLSNVGSFSWDISTSAKSGYLVTSAGLRLGNLTINYGTYSDSITVCCTALAQINGSINLSHF